MNNHEELRLKCVCSDALHFIELSAKFWDEDGHIYVTLVSDRGFSFWRRAKAAISHVLGRSDIASGEIILSQDGVQTLRDWLKITDTRSGEVKR